MHVSLDSALGRQRRLNSVGESVLQIAPNAAAAYSLRSLTGGDPKVVRVRRASDNGERDFTSSEITSGEMVSWVNRQVIAPLDIQALEADGRTGDFLIAKAAYSLRSLGTRQATITTLDTFPTFGLRTGKFVVQVRRSSDDAFKSFTADEVTDGTLLAFTNADYAKYTSDFSAGDDSWGAFDDVTETGNIDGIGGLDNNLRLAIGSATSQHRGYRSNALPANQKINFSARVFIPSTNSVVDSIGIRDASGSVIIPLGTTPAQDQWVTVTANNVTVSNQQLRVDIQDGGTNTFAGNGSDVIYLREITVTQVTSDGLVKTWYDQSVTNEAGDTATGNHAVQATTASQPKIVNAGALVANGLDFDGSDDELNMPTDLIASINSASTFLVAKSDTDSSSRIALALSRNSPDFRFYVGALLSSKFHFGYQDTALKIELSSADTNKHLFTSIAGSSNAEGFLDGTSKGTVSSVDGKSALSSGGIGGINSGVFWDGTIQEIVVYNSDQTANRTAIEANIGEAYSITGIPAYDNEVDGFVETWYDQSGNSNNVTQATAGNQPKIVSAGTLVTATNSLPAIDFTSSITRLARAEFLTGQLNSYFNTYQAEAGDSTQAQVVVRQGANYRLVNQVETNGQIRSQIRDSGGSSEVVQAGGDLATGSPVLHTTLIEARGSDGITIFVNGANEVSGDTADIEDTNFATADTGDFAIGAIYNSNSFDFHGKGQEFIFYNSDQSANRVAVETNINSHYSIF